MKLLTSVGPSIPQDISAIAAGTLTEILNMWATASPLAGDQVNVTAIVKNISAESLAIACTGLYDDTPLTFSPDYIWIDPGKNYSFKASFIMPNKDVRLHVWSFYWTGAEWIDDDYVYLDVALGEAPPPTKEEFKNLEITSYTEEVDVGGICRVETKFDYKGPETERGLYAAIGHQIYGPGARFDEKVAGEIRMAMPETATLITYYCGVDIPITSGKINPADSPFDLYAKVKDGLFPLAQSPTYDNVITVTAPPVEYTGSIVFTDMYKSPEGQIPFPATVVANNEYFKVFFDCRNTSAVTLRVGVEMKVYDPTGLRAAPTIDWFDLKSFQTLESEYNNFCRVDKVGVWRIEARFLEQSTSAVLDEKTFTMTATAVEYAGSITEVWINKAPEGTGLSPDTTVVADGNTFEVGTRARNDSSVTFTGTVQVVVYDPDHVKRVDKSDSTGIDPGENLYFGEGLGATFNICSVDKAGDWIIVVVFRGDEMTLAHKEYIMTAVPAFPDPDFQNFAITGYDSVPVDEQLMVTPGQTATVHMTVDYRGRAIDGSIYTAMGWKEIWFIPIFSSMTPVHFEASYDFLTYEIDCDVDIKTIDPAAEILYGTLLDMYAKIVGVPGPDIYTPFYTGVIAWGKPIEEYELIQHTIHHFAYIYDGDDETTIVTLKTDPFKPADWVPEKFISELEREARESGVRILETKVYVDTSPLFWTDYRIEVTGTPSGEVTGVGVGGLPAIPLFVKIILLALAVAFGIWIVSWAVKQFVGIFQHKPGLEDVKVAWGKEALILDIHDAEEYWERTLTPIETLEGKSEDELRDILDQIAEEEVPEAEFPWALVAVGGLGVLGVGAVALATRRKE
ncbi:hypothetical protein ES703_40751 [subsurface metagenome]